MQFLGEDLEGLKVGKCLFGGEEPRQVRPRSLGTTDRQSYTNLIQESIIDVLGVPCIPNQKIILV